VKQHRFFPLFFTVVMLVTVLFLAWYIPSVCERRFQLEDVRKSLETSQGRERKQQYEYDKVLEEIPEVQAELDRIQPVKEAAEKEMKDLKSQRKKLRAEKKELEEQLSGTSEQEGSSDEQ